jgi:3-oxoacyl-[acyl-carrier-protein] synthase III
VLTRADNIRGVRIAGVEHVIPSNKITNADVLDRLRCESGPYLSPVELDELLRLTAKGLKTAGTEVRYLREEGEIAHELCVRAGRAALAAADVSPLNVDLLLYVGVGRGFLEPATANVFQDLLGLRNATCFDVMDACGSWLRAFEIARTFILAGGRYRTVMILNGEFLGRYAYRFALRSLDEFQHWFPGVTVGEASTATVICASKEPDHFAADFRTWGQKRGLCLIPLANVHEYLGQSPPEGVPLIPLEFYSFGTQLLRFGASKLVEHYKGVDTFHKEYDVVFGHAASDGICESVGRRCGLEFEKFEFTHRLVGNTASASLPVAMSLAHKGGRLRSGSRILVLCASSGISTALMRFRWL